jgi:RimJ/RimL family protein N-acetyltransferase
VTPGRAPDLGVFFRTRRLDVRRFRPTDVEDFAAYRADPDVARYQSWSDYTREQAVSLVASQQDLELGTPGAWSQLALEDRSLGALVGDLACRVDEVEPRQLEVGFTVAAAHQGRGYATEALRGLLDHAFGAMGMHRVVAVTDARNAASASLLTRVGMRQEAHFVENVFFKGEWGSELLFAVLDREHRSGG